MKKNLPPSTLDALRMPNKSYNYFQDWQAHPFKHDANDLELLNAWWLMEASLLAYADSDFIAETFETAGLTAAGIVVEFIEREHTQCFVAHNKELILIAFRGSQIDISWDSALDWATDLHFIPVPDRLGGLVHQGFKTALDSIWDSVKRYVVQVREADGLERKVWITGHSLGAALATLAAYRAVTDASFAVQGLYTYGSPRVGDYGFKTALCNAAIDQRTFRFVNNKDIIAKLPPRGLYTHVGALKYIDNAGHIHSLDEESEMASAADGSQLESDIEKLRTWQRNGSDFQINLPDFIVDHFPINYATRVWNCYDNSNTGLIQAAKQGERSPSAL